MIDVFSLVKIILKTTIIEWTSLTRLKNSLNIINLLIIEWTSLTRIKNSLNIIKSEHDISAPDIDFLTTVWLNIWIYW